MINNQNIWQNYRRYYSTPSLTYQEKRLADVLLADYPGSYQDSETGVVVWPGDPTSRICFIVHMDRIQVGKVDFIFEEGGSLPVIGGQLDNTICLACLRTLYDLGYKFNAIFTVQEEVCQAHKVVIDIARFYNWTIIDCDIDVFYKGDEWIDSISLRLGDNIARYTPWLVYKFWGMAECSGIKFSHKTDWLIGTVGFVRRDAPDVAGLYLGLPILNYHSGKEFASLESKNAYTTFMGKVIEE